MLPQPGRGRGRGNARGRGKPWGNSAQPQQSAGSNASAPKVLAGVQGKPGKVLAPQATKNAPDVLLGVHKTEFPGPPEELFDPGLFTWEGEKTLAYRGEAVFFVVDRNHTRAFVGDDRTLYVTSELHPLKGWLQRGDVDVTVAKIHGVVHEEEAGRYLAMEAEDNLDWTCSFGDLENAKGVLQAIARSEALDAVVWDATSFCTAGWVASLMPTLTTNGTFVLPSRKVVIGQNVHSTDILGSAWVKRMQGDCRQADFPPAWTARVRSELCPRAATHADFQEIATLCELLTAAGFQPMGQDDSPKAKAERAKRIEYLIEHEDKKEVLRKLPRIEEYYPEQFADQP